jgi:hypothetical protein
MGSFLATDMPLHWLILNNNQNPLAAPDFRLAAGATQRHRSNANYACNCMRLIDNWHYGQQAVMTL